jgi:dynein heavy chain 2
LIKEWKDLMNEISDKQALLITVKSSEYFSRFIDQIDQFENKFANIEIWLGNLNIIQRKWIYLEPIFMRNSLPSETQKFKRIDEEFRNIMLTLNSNGKVQALFSISNIKDTLEMLIENLEKSQKVLNDFLEEKRNKFARLYFLGDDDLLEFLAKSKDKAVIKNNLRKLYQGITTLTLKEGKISRMKNNVIKEKIDLKSTVNLVDDLEKWLNDLTGEMQKTLATYLDEGVSGLRTSDFSNMKEYCGQICCVVVMVKFTSEIEKAIISKNIKSLLESTLNSIDKLTIIQSKIGENVLEIFKIKNLMLDLIHNREVAEFLIKTQTNDTSEWQFYKQLKYIYNKANLKVGMCDAFFDYTFEYQGSSQRLVHTPLTDKCYLTLTQSLRLGYGGNPYGPAGTGKTETVKALGQALGRQVLVFNCDEGIDFKAMGRIFIGLVKSGAWGCFDEFNRLLEEQLSAISIQIQIIQNALKQQISNIILLNTHIHVNFQSAVFVTLNPAGKGYGGRSKLPDNLKILFRPVAMSVPDNNQIAQTLLYAEGFKNAEILAQKVVSLFTLCKQGLSAQIHYDWGLRALKTILTVANQQIQSFLVSGEKADYDKEVEVLIKAIRINTLSKLTYDDTKKFNNLIEDVFPNARINDIFYEDLNRVLLESYKELNFEMIETQMKKVVQFHEACRQRMGVVLVGPSGCGKTTIWKLLKHSYTKLKQNVIVQIINPKSMPRNVLLGHMNHETGEYTYGVLTKCAREVEKQPLDTKCWIICDGDVDPEWIEALNSVLDDNRLLTMQNGERINFGNNVNFIFETDSLKFASPATVSRMGIIYMNEEDLEVKSVVNAWVKKQKESLQNNYFSWFESYFFESYKNLFGPEVGVKIMLNTTPYGLVNNFLFLAEGAETKGMFIDALIRGLGGVIGIEDRKRFAVEMFSLSGEKPANVSSPLTCYFDYGSKSFKEYMDINNNQEENSINLKDFNSIRSNPLIKTKTVQYYLDILKKWLETNDTFIIVGPEGCGKSLIINYSVSQIKSCQVTLNDHLGIDHKL